MKQWIQHWDLRVIQHLQERWSSSMMDTIMLFARNPYTWSPLYLFLAGWMWMRFGRKGLRWCLFFLLTFAISDFVGARLIKPFVHRIRPCMDTDVGPFIRHVVACGSGYSFPSVHACNHFALAAFMTGTLQRLIFKVEG